MWYKLKKIKKQKDVNEMKNMRKFLSFLLVLSIMCSVLPTSTSLLAAELNSYTKVTVLAGADAPIVSDRCSGVTITKGEQYLTVTT